MFFGGFGTYFQTLWVFYVDCALFRPKRPPGARYWAKTEFLKQLENLSNTRSVSACQTSFHFLFLFFRNFVLAQNRAPGGLLGRKRAQSTQKTPENLKMRPNITMCYNFFFRKVEKQTNNKQNKLHQTKTERVLDKFSSFFPGGKGLNKLFQSFFGFWVLFSDSLAFSASIAPFFVPKDPLGPDFGAKQNKKIRTSFF